MKVNKNKAGKEFNRQQRTFFTSVNVNINCASIKKEYILNSQGPKLKI